MKAIILSAGKGSRLYPLTKDRPKGMVEINGKSIITRQIEIFRDLGIDDISVIKGYQAESVIVEGIKHYLNSRYDITNMVYSLFCAKEELNDDEVIVSYGDILYTKDVLKKLMMSNEDISVVVDLDWKSYYIERHGNPYDDAESLILDDKSRIKSIGKPNPSPEEVEAQYIGLMKFNRKGLDIIKSIYSSSFDNKVNIGWERPVQKAYMTDLLQEIIKQGYDVFSTLINGGWAEIDDFRDYEIACKLFK